MDLVRHTYLHFEVEPLVYARSQAMDRLLPLLRPVQNAPLEFTYKADIVALLTECLIKAIEAQTMDVGLARPVEARRSRATAANLNATTPPWPSTIARPSRCAARRSTATCARAGCSSNTSTTSLAAMQKEGTSLRDEIGPMVYGMDVDRERHHDEQIAFLPEGSSGDVIRRAPRQLAGLDLAEMKLMKGDADGAEQMAEAALKSDPNNAQAHYLLGRIDLMQGDPDAALGHLTQTIQLSHDPRTIAWAHIYLGRMYDIARDPDNPDAVKPQRAKGNRRVPGRTRKPRQPAGYQGRRRKKASKNHSLCPSARPARPTCSPPRDRTTMTHRWIRLARQRRTPTARRLRSPGDPTYGEVRSPEGFHVFG